MQRTGKHLYCQLPLRLRVEREHMVGGVHGHARGGIASAWGLVEAHQKSEPSMHRYGARQYGLIVTYQHLTQADVSMNVHEEDGSPRDTDGPGGGGAGGDSGDGSMNGGGAADDANVAAAAAGEGARAAAANVVGAAGTRRLGRRARAGQHLGSARAIC